MKGPEDSAAWIRYVGDPVHVNRECRSCGKEITYWHCADIGCGWCAECGANAKDLREKRKNGKD